MFERAIRLPIVRQLYQLRYDRGFARDWVGTFRGVYSSFDDAMRSAPGSKPLGYDHEGPARMYQDRFDHVQPNDYPVLFWLDRLLAAGARRVFDLGGHVGVTYYGYRKYLSYPADLEWTVFDTPSVRSVGEEIARERGVAGSLRFAASPEAADGSDVLLCAGSLQYIEKPTLPDLLAGFRKKPRWILLNKTPLTEKEGFVTLQNIGTAFCPYRVFNAEAFIAGIASEGYALRDRWGNGDVSLELPMDPERGIKWYSGLLFEHASSGSGDTGSA